MSKDNYSATSSSVFILGSDNGRIVCSSSKLTAPTKGSSSNQIEADITARKYIQELKLAEESLRRALNSITELRKENDRLEQLVSDLDNRLRKQANINRQAVNTSDLTTKDLKFILSRIHPDKNPGSTMANYLTTKIINIKRRYE